MRRAALDELMSRIGERVLEQDDLLRTSWAIRGNDRALKGIFDRFVDVCLEQLFLDLEFRHTVGELTADEYLLETARLISQCRAAGVHPPVSVRDLDLDAEDEADRLPERPESD